MLPWGGAPEAATVPRSFWLEGVAQRIAAQHPHLHGGRGMATVACDISLDRAWSMGAGTTSCTCTVGEDAVNGGRGGQLGARPLPTEIDGPGLALGSCARAHVICATRVHTEHYGRWPVTRAPRFERPPTMVYGRTPSHSSLRPGSGPRRPQRGGRLPRENRGLLGPIHDTTSRPHEACPPSAWQRSHAWADLSPRVTVPRRQSSPLGAA